MTPRPSLEPPACPATGTLCSKMSILGEKCARDTASNLLYPPSTREYLHRRGRKAITRGSRQCRIGRRWCRIGRCTARRYLPPCQAAVLPSSSNTRMPFLPVCPSVTAPSCPKLISRGKLAARRQSPQRPHLRRRMRRHDRCHECAIPHHWHGHARDTRIRYGDVHLPPQSRRPPSGGMGDEYRHSCADRFARIEVGDGCRRRQCTPHDDQRRSTADVFTE